MSDLKLIAIGEAKALFDLLQRVLQKVSRIEELIVAKPNLVVRAV
jgi:hypothetical protein